MALLLRAFKHTKYGTRVDIKVRWPDWCPKEDVPAQLLSDWAENSLSLWQIDDNEENLEDVIAAFTYRGEITTTDFLLFNESIPRDIGLVPEKSEGRTEVPSVDAKFHCHLPQMTASKVRDLLARIVTDLKAEKAFVRRLKGKDVKRILAQRLESYGQDQETGEPS